MKLIDLKNELKSLAQEIKDLKSHRKICTYGYVPGLLRTQEKFRLSHIAYGILRGRKYEEMEAKVSEEKKLTKHQWSIIQAIIETHNEEKKLYVVVDGSVSKNHQFVQASHAMAQFLIENPNTKWKNGTIVMLKAPKEKFDELVVQAGKLNIRHSKFVEPFWGNRMTGFAGTGLHLLTQGLSLI